MATLEEFLAESFLIKEEINSYAMKKTLKAVSQVLISSKNPGDYNQGIMELGQKTCLKAKPLCTICPVKSFCKAYAKGQTNKVPVVVQNKKTVDIGAMTALVVQGKILLSHRGENSRFLKNRTGFSFAGVSEKKGTSLGSFSHRITHHKITVDVIKPSNQPILSSEDHWVNYKDLEKFELVV